MPGVEFATSLSARWRSKSAFSGSVKAAVIVTSRALRCTADMRRAPSEYDHARPRMAGAVPTHVPSPSRFTDDFPSELR